MKQDKRLLAMSWWNDLSLMDQCTAKAAKFPNRAPGSLTGREIQIVWEDASREELIPKIGEQLYIPGSYSISHGSSDVAGGLATINRVKIDDRLPVGHTNRIFVGFEGTDPAHTWNYSVLLREQDQLKKDYEGQLAHPDPDIDTPWIEPGDIVNGKEWTGDPIW